MSKAGPKVPALKPHILRQILGQHMSGRFNHLERNPIFVFPEWQKYANYKFATHSRAESAFMNKLLDQLVEPKSMIRAIELLVAVSEHKQSAADVEPTHASLVLAPITNHHSVSATDDLELMMQAARRAQSYVKGFETAPYEARLRIILAYCTLYLTLEYGVASKIRAEHQTFNKNQIKAAKWAMFNTEMGIGETQVAELHQLRDNVKFGKMLWNWAEDCGIVWLAVFAGMDRGIKTFLRKCPSKSGRSKLAGSQLATKDSWVAFSEALAGVVVSLLFAPISPVFTVAELLRLYISQDNGTNSAFLFQEAIWTMGYKANLYTIDCKNERALQVDNALAGTLFERVGVDIPRLPRSLLNHSNSVRIELVSWVLHSPPTTMIELKDEHGPETTTAKIYLVDAASLFACTRITKPVFSFLVQLWDASGINSWCCFSLQEGERFLNLSPGCSIYTAMQKAARSKSYYNKVNFLLIPVETSTSYLLHICNLLAHTVTVYYLPGTQDIESLLKHTLNVS